MSYATLAPKPETKSAATSRSSSPAVSSNLRIGEANDAFEQQADRVAGEVMSGRVPQRDWDISRVSIETPLQRKCSCGGNAGPSGECEECRKKKLQRKAVISPGVSSSDSLAPPIVHEVLRSPGQPLDAATRAYMEPRFGHDFSQVRVHTDSRAADSAQAVNAQAYTVGRDVVFGAGRYRPHNGEGQRLIAHELTHVMQQKSGDETPPSTIRRVEDFYEMGAQRMAKSITSSEATANLQRSGYQPVPMITRHSISAKVQRQLITPLAPGGGFGGLMDRDRNANTALNQSQYRVCARDLQGTAGVIANHAYVETPTNRYAVMGPFCGSGLDNVLTGTTAQKWDHSPDPCGQTPHCLPCNPLPGITDVGACLRDAFNAYNSPSLYNAPFGPNSNTFAGTLARRCCAGMNVKPTIFGNVPAWDNAPAPARAGKSPCPPGPTCGG